MHQLRLPTCQIMQVNFRRWPNTRFWRWIHLQVKPKRALRRIILPRYCCSCSTASLQLTRDQDDDTWSAWHHLHIETLNCLVNKGLHVLVPIRAVSLELLCASHVRNAQQPTPSCIWHTLASVMSQPDRRLKVLQPRPRPVHALSTTLRDNMPGHWMKVLCEIACQTHVDEKGV